MRVPRDGSGGGGDAQAVLVVLAFLALAGLGNLIGGTDTPGRAAVDPAGGSGVVRAEVPVAPRFDATMYVSASSLNLRERLIRVGAC